MSDPRVGELRWDGYVRDMLAACEKVMSYTDGMDQAAFVADEAHLRRHFAQSGHNRRSGNSYPPTPFAKRMKKSRGGP